MRRTFLACLAVSAAAILGFGIAPAAAQTGSSGYHVIKKYKIGGEGFWDYMKMDSPARHLFISRGTHVVVLNPDTGEVVGDIPDTEGVHGIAISHKLNRGFTSNGESSTVTIFDLTTLKVIDKVKTTGTGPDAIIYDPASERVFTFNGRSDNSTAIDAATGKVAGTVELGGRPEFAAADGRGEVFSNLEDKSKVDVIDSKDLKVLHTWPLAPCESPSGMAIDREHHRLFIGCHNEMMAIMDADNGHIIATPPIGKGVDANRFDPGTGLAFSSNGEGNLTIVQEDSPDKFTEIDSVPTQRGARTMAVDLQTHNVYLVTADFGPMPPPVPGQRFQRPNLIPGSFTVLVVGK